MSIFICVNCKTSMRCLKNGVAVDYGYGHIYPGDVWKCETCGCMIVYTNNRPCHDPGYRAHDFYIRHKESGKKPIDCCAPEDKIYRP